MLTPFTRLRRTAYQSVDASLGPWILCHGFPTLPSSRAMPALKSCRPVAT